MNPREKYGVDRSAESAGAPVVIDDMTFIVRSTTAANRRYRYALALASDRRRAQGIEIKPGDPLSFDAYEDMLIEAFAEHVILGWEGVTNGDGHALEFTRENCIALMQDCPDVWDQIRAAAFDASRFALSSPEEDGEQLGKS